MKLLSFLSVLFFLFFASCVNNKKDEPIPITASECGSITYTANVVPIIQQNCTTPYCHDAGSVNGNFNNYEELKIRVDDGRFRNSVIEGKTPVMPQTGKLPDAQIRILQCWLNNGAPKN
jgi:hypothetical protein